MIFSDVAVYAQNGKILPHQYVAVREDRIAAVSASSIIPERGEETINGKNRLLMPGLINTHTHIAMSLLRGYAENLPLQRWLNEKVFPFEDQLSPEDVYAGSMLSMAEMLRFGTTSFTDMYYFCDRTAEAMLSVGMRGNISRGIVCPDPAVKLADLPAYQEAVDLFTSYHHAGNDLIRVDFSAHAEYTNTEDAIRMIAKTAAEYGARVHIHLSETLFEHEECKCRHNGMTPTAFFEYCGMFSNPVTAAHGVYLEEEDIRILKEHDAAVAHNPVSNLKLGSGIAPVPEMLDAGLRVTLGTDGPASNNQHNLWEEIKLASILQKGVRKDPTLMPPEKVIAMATAEGAASQGRTDTGEIAVGKKADLIMIDLDTPNMASPHPIANQLAYSMDGSNILLTMVDGKILYLNGEWLTLDIERVKFDAIQSAKGILGKLS